MKVIVADAEGIVLDYLVCEAAGLLAAYPRTRRKFKKIWESGLFDYTHPTTKWKQGGPIIDKLRGKGLQLAEVDTTVRASLDGVEGFYYGDTTLEAVLKCYVASELGKEVEVPEGLI